MDPFNQQPVPNTTDRIRRMISHIPQLALNQLTELAAAIRFLTVLPVPGLGRLFRSQENQITQPATASLGLGSGYFPLVGLLLALLLSLLVVVFERFLPSLALSALLVVVLILLTGGLHLDGLMDTCDGLFGGGTREHRLEIMQDSRLGSFAMLGGVGALLLKFAFFASLQERVLIPALLIALPTSRWTMVLTLSLFPSARSSGLGVTFRQVITHGRLVLAGLIALIIALIFGRLVGLVVWVIATLIAIAVAIWIMRRLGGLTGDTYGAIEEVTEVVALLVLVMLQTGL
jgi:adenosylcobinamide-GDP ribazoletransferase